MSNTQPVVETIDLTKAYDNTTVVDKLNLTIGEGEVFGFLGPNGAGKTTTILMLLGLTEPTSGMARICGYNSTREPLKVKRISGYVPERVGFYEDLTAVYNLTYTARLNGFSTEFTTKKISDVLGTVGLSEVAEREVGTYSRGMKQRLAIADILIKMPKVAFLDEPTSGIDPEGVVEMLDLISGIAREQKMTVVLSSHQLAHVQRICGRVGIISKGRMVVEGPLDQLGREALAGGQFMIEVQLTEITSDIIDCIKKIDGVATVERSGDLLIIGCNTDLRPQVARAIVEADGLLVQMKIQSYALEDIYMKYFTER
ncbi:Vitamin B12 import ATP-binding protein BtuD [subsurface metagenome]